MIVLKVEEGDDRKQVTATTYQMRNFYRQFGDGFFSVLDIMNYIQHQTVVRLAKSDDRILDMCCGRGLLLPMLRYERAAIESYTGVDIKESNAVFRKVRVTDSKPITKGYYPFKVYFVHENVATMSSKLPNNYFTFIVYTSSIEHMQPSDGLQSLFEARKVAKKGATLFLSCPNTPEDQDGYDAQYAAHVYEWKRSEVEKGLKEAGWHLDDVYGLLIDSEKLKSRLTEVPQLHQSYQRQSKYIPREWLNPMYASLFPEDAKELAFIATAI
jgi:ubiquinone/menaquinone biosynthesis C-methylase UbiE